MTSPQHGARQEELAEVLGRFRDAPELDTVAAALIYDEPAASATVGIWRFSAGEWSVILKVLAAGGSHGSALWQAGVDPDHWYYWKREALAYSSGFLGSLSGGLRAPTCFGVFDRPDGAIGVWLEDLRADRSAAAWSVEQYRASAEALGRAQAASAARVGSGTEPWLGRKWLDSYVERRGSFFDVVNDPAWDHPLVRDHLPAGTRDAAVRIWDDRHELLGIVSAAPLVLCHNDVHPGNLFADGPDTVLIDWSFASIGPAGVDPATLVFDAVLDFFVPTDRLGDVRTAVTEGYVAGFSEAMPRTDVDTLARAIRAASAVKYFWIPLAMVDAVAKGRETMNRRPLLEAFPIWAEVVPEILAERTRVGGRPST